MINIKREELLHQIEAVQPGLSPRDIVEQSTCVIFQDGKIQTYNDEIACSYKCALAQHMTGAARATSLISILRKLTEEDLTVEINDGEIIFIGKKRKVGINLEKEISLGMDVVEKPKKWIPLHEEFGEAVKLVHECAGKDANKFAQMCVHVHPNWVEACDDFQMARYKLDTGVKASTIVRKTSIKHITDLGMTEFSETPAWMHFRNPSGLVFSCRRFLDEYKDITPHFKVQGEKTTLPKGLVDATSRAEVFSSENKENNFVFVDLRPGKVRIRSEGATGWFSEIKNIQYHGSAISFYITPKLLIELTQRHNDCIINESRLKVKTGNFSYVACLGKPEEPNEKD